jgi:hypothetical protein
MKRIIFILIGVVLGFGVGWYFGYTRPVAQNQRRILKEYQIVRDLFQYDDAETTKAAETFPKPKEVLASFAREDELVAAVALRTVKLLDKGDSEAAKQSLLQMLGSYYRIHRTNDLYTNLVAHIEKAALESPSIAVEISKKSE